jgi:outer membrane lipoprotein carrier protein
MIESGMMNAECGGRKDKRTPTPPAPLQRNGKGRGWVLAEDEARSLFPRYGSAILALLLVLLAWPASSGAENAPSVTAAPVAATGLVGIVERHYHDLADLTASIVQKNFLKSIDKTQTFEGTLSIKKPGRLRLEYTNGQLIVIDGKEAWFYSKKNEQAIRRTFRDFEQANIPVAFLLGAANIQDDFAVVERTEGARYRLDLTPRRKDAAMKKIGIICDDVGRILELVIYDRSGNTSTIEFSNVRESTGLSDTLFLFKAPKGTEIIEQ